MFIGDYFAIWYDVCGGKEAIQRLSDHAVLQKEAEERAEYARLKAKYEPVAAPAPDPIRPSTLEDYVARLRAGTLPCPWDKA